MSETILLASKVLFAGVGCAAGVRLARIARREGGIPLHGWASAMVLLGGLGMLGFGVGPVFAERSESFARGLMIVSDGVIRLAIAGLAVFLFRVFGGGSGRRTTILCAVLAIVAANWWRTLAAQSWPLPTPSAQRCETQIALAIPFVWSSVEAFLAFAQSRKQLALGLTAPATTNRFLLWCLASSGFAATGICGSVLAVSPSDSALHTGVTMVQAALYVATAAAVVLALFPPASFVRRLQAESR